MQPIAPEEVELYKGQTIIADIIMWVVGILFVLSFIYIIAGSIYGEERLDEVVADVIIKTK